LEAGDKRVVDTKLMDVKVGDVLVLNDKQIIPADCIILATTSENCPEGGEEGFIQTA
jgi:magnesium-transporting ATPase (P-type)